MKKYFERFKDLIFDRPFEEIMDALEYEGPKEALKKSVPFLVAGAGGVCLLVLVLAFLYSARETIGRIIILIVVGVVFVASYRENHRPTGPAIIKAPTMEQYVTGGNILKLAAKRVAPMLELNQIYDESDVKAAKDERIVQSGKCWFLKYRLLKKNATVAIDEAVAQRVLQNELRMVLDNDNPAGFDRVRFVYGGVDECVLQVAHITQGDLYLYVYLCYASEEYFSQREREVEQHDTADTNDIDF